MIPVLYKANETKFDSQGVGCLTDCITCYVHEKLNGVYELKFTYPITGVHFSDIKVGAIVDAIPSDGKAVQHFRIDTITKPIGGKVTVEATHISYQLSYVPVKPFDAVGVLEALNGLKDHSLTSNPFSVWTDISNTATKYTQKEPASFRQRLGGVAGSILDCFGGEYEFDNYTVKLHAHRGIDRGVVIEYGKNLTDLEQEESIDKVITGIVPFWKDSNDKVVSIETPIESEYASKYPFKRTVVKDFSSNFEEEPTVEQLRAYTESYIKNNCVGVPQVSLDVSFVALEDTEEYKSLSRERINLGDTVTVRFAELGVDAKAKVIEYKYDVLAERYDSLKIGSVRSSLASTISEITKVADSAVTKSILDAVIKYQTELIKGGLGGYVVTNYVNGYPSEIIVGDAPNIEQMVNCIRLNKNGLGISKTGYNGSYRTAITGEGINADLINFGELDGNLIKAKTLQIGSFDEATENTITSSLSEAVTEWYVSTSPTEPIGGSWSESRPAWTESNYIWQRLRTENKKGEISYSEPSCVQGNTGANGQNGTNGRGIKSTEVTYQIWTDGTTTPSGTWSTSVPDTTADKPYLWTRTIITYTDNTKSTSYSVGSTLKGVNVGGRNLFLQSKTEPGTNYEKGEEVNGFSTIWKTFVKNTFDYIDSYSHQSDLLIPRVGQTYTIQMMVRGRLYKKYAYKDYDLSSTNLFNIKTVEYDNSDGIYNSTAEPLNWVTAYSASRPDSWNALKNGTTHTVGSIERIVVRYKNELYDAYFYVISANGKNCNCYYVLIGEQNTGGIQQFWFPNVYGNGASDSRTKIKVSENWKLHSHQWTPSSELDSETQHGMILCRLQTDIGVGTVEIYAPKFELGNIATDWTPAPEDVDADISNAQTTANSAKTNASNAQSSANNALDTANKADAKADQAKSDAASANTAAQIAKKQADNAQAKSDEANRIANGAQIGVSNIEQVVKIDTQGVRIYEKANSKNYVHQKSDGSHFYTNNIENGVLGPDSRMNNLAVQDYLMFGAHRAELKIEDGEEGTALFHVGDIK